MKRLRTIFMAVTCLIGCVTAHGQDDFNPSSPSEPGAPTIYSRIVLLRNISEAGSVSGDGKYAVGSSVKVYAYTNSSYSFSCWTNTKGDTLSVNSSFTFVNTENTDTLVANYRFVPGNPSEPSEPSTTLYYKVVVQPTQGLTVSGGGRYLAGKSVYLSANVETGYSFLGWYNRLGNLVSSDKGFNYTVPVDGDTLTAKCVFNPGVPSEPGDPILRHNVSVTCADGGYWRGTSGRVLEGNSFSLNAYVNTGYEFQGWYLNGELYTKLRSFSYTMGKENVNFYAKIVFNPSSPNEPLMPDLQNYSFYLMTVNGEPGDTVKYPIYLNNTKVVKDMQIRLTFPANVTPNLDNFTVGSNAVGYTISLAEAVDTISVIEEGAKLWDFSLIGGTTQPGTGALLTFDIAIPDTMATGGNHQVKINQLSMTKEDGETITARTRNGRIGVYKRGDSNGDDVVNVTDILNMLTHLEGKDSDSFIQEVSDVNKDGVIDGNDTDGIIQIITEE